MTTNITMGEDDGDTSGGEFLLGKGRQLSKNIWNKHKKLLIIY